MPITSSKSTAGPLVAAARSENFNITIPDAATPDDIGAYPQQLKRSMSTLMSFSFAFTAVGVISSLTALFPTSLSTGGAGVLFWSWITASISTLLTGLSMGELASAYPNAGSVYYWSARLAPNEWAPLLSFTCGWFNFLGNTAADAFFAQTLAMFLSQVMEQSPFHPELTSLSTEWQVIISISTMFIFAVINCMPIRFQGVLNYIGTFIQLVSTLAVVLTLIITCPQQSSQQVGTSTTHNNSDNTNYMAKSASDIFFSTFNGTGLDDSYLFYVYLIGTLGSFYSFVGYEASGHLGEETKNPSRSVPRGIVYTCVASALTGLCYLLCLLVAVAGNVDGFLSSSDQPSVFQIFTQCTSPYGALSLSILLIVNVFFSGMSSLTTTVRICFALARDGGFPASRLVSHVNPHRKIPDAAVLSSFITGSLLLLLQLGSSTAFIAVTSLSTIGYQISYLIPITLRITCARDSFPPTPLFSLGSRFNSLVVGSAAATFLATTSLLFLLPTSFPVTVSNFNYTSVVLVVVGAMCGLYWRIEGMRVFRGPQWNIEIKGG